MAIKKIITYPNNLLRTKTEIVEQFDAELKAELDDMWETMYATEGIGLAAPQIGLGKKIAIIDYEGEKHTLINPVILEKDGSCTYEEGCLSFPGIYVDVESPQKIKIKYQDENGREQIKEIEGFLACVFSHEIDHLNGKLLIDRVSSLKRQFIKKRILKCENKDSEV